MIFRSSFLRHLFCEEKITLYLMYFLNASLVRKEHHLLFRIWSFGSCSLTLSNDMLVQVSTIFLPVFITLAWMLLVSYFQSMNKCWFPLEHLTGVSLFSLRMIALVLSGYNPLLILSRWTEVSSVRFPRSTSFSFPRNLGSVLLLNSYAL